MIADDIPESNAHFYIFLNSARVIPAQHMSCGAAASRRRGAAASGNESASTGR